MPKASQQLWSSGGVSQRVPPRIEKLIKLFRQREQLEQMENPPAADCLRLASEFSLLQAPCNATRCMRMAEGKQK